MCSILHFHKGASCVSLIGIHLLYENLVDLYSNIKSVMYLPSSKDCYSHTLILVPVFVILYTKCKI